MVVGIGLLSLMIGAVAERFLSAELEEAAEEASRKPRAIYSRRSAR